MQYSLWKRPVKQFPFCKHLASTLWEYHYRVQLQCLHASEVNNTGCFSFFPTSINGSLTFPCQPKALQNDAPVEFTFIVRHGKEILHFGTYHSQINLGRETILPLFGQLQENMHFSTAQQILNI